MHIRYIHERNVHVFISRVCSILKHTCISCYFLVPPEKPVILSKDGREIGAVAGPYVEGSDAKLICKVQGGKYAERRFTVVQFEFLCCYFSGVSDWPRF